MDYNSVSFLLIMIASVLVLAFRFSPAYRRARQNKFAEQDRKREAEIAQLIASGEAVLIKANKRPFWFTRNGLCLLCGLLLFPLFAIYIDQVTESCTSKWGLNGQFIKAMFFMVWITLFSIIQIVITIKSYKKAILDGYSPARRDGYYLVDTLCFKLTPIIRRRLKNGSMVMVLLSVLFICFPVVLFITSKHPTLQDLKSFSRLNGLYQTVCLERLQSSRLLK